MVMDNNDRTQRACILLADYEPLYYTRIRLYIDAPNVLFKFFTRLTRCRRYSCCEYYKIIENNIIYIVVHLWP